MNTLRTILTAALLSGLATTGRADAPNFNQDIRPILSDKCYFCHGPDEENRQADLRLDVADDAHEAIASGELVRRVLSDDEYEQMPPPEVNLPLTEEEKQLLKAWVESGAEYERHWSFEPLPREVPLPVNTKDDEAKDDEAHDDWSKQTLDRFVWAALYERGRQPSPAAAPLRWLRRVTFDLTGLPPTLEEADAFLAALEKESDREQAYQQVVDRLLASPAYGEHMAVAWLDAARYADSYGYQSDQLNTQWSYRDWVVRAFNDNLPYDQFLTWQLAGDLLDSPTSDQRLATAFNRIHRLNNEGGAIFEEWRLENVADRVHTFGTAVLGLTLECCRCHDHKYDPISMRDYYSLSAFFNTINESGVYDTTVKSPAPSLLLPTDEQAAALEEAQQALTAAEEAYRQTVADAKQRFNEWDAPRANLTTPDLIRSVSLDQDYTKELKEVYYSGQSDGGSASPLEVVEVTNSTIPRLAPNEATDGQQLPANKEDAPPRRALRLDGERGIVLPGIETFDRWNPFSLVISLRETKRSPATSVLAQSSFGQLAFNGWDLTLVDGFLQLRMYRDWPGNAIGIRTLQRIPADEWIQVTASYDGASQAKGLKLYLNGAPLETEVLEDKVWKRSSITVNHGGKLTIGQRFRDRGLDGGLIDDVRVFGRALTPTEIAHFATGAAIKPTLDYYVSAVDEAARATLAELNAARQAFVMAEEAIIEVPVMEEMDSPRETHVLARGAYDAPTGDDTRVTRSTFTSVGPAFPTDAPLDRLGLARWVTLPEHPLTARVFVNRLWGNFFSQGLVGTPDNFGLQGELPTHPELLDWLSRDFVESGWDIKRLCRAIVLSSTYRQDSRATKELAAADPDNKWLARGPAHRLSSEQIRDLALTSSGLLNAQRGGPPVSPYQAGGDLWRESNSMSPSYRQSVGKDLYRRSLYSVWKRTAPLPNMLAFDAESREVCIVKRTRTNTPLQALVLMNDVQFVEAARALAEQSLQENEDVAARIAWAFRRLTGRRPDAREGRVLVELFASEVKHYTDDQPAAGELIAAGESTPAETIDPVELAGMTVVCQAIMNLDATVWKR